MSVINTKETQLFDVYIGRGAGGAVAETYGEKGWWGNPIKLTKDNEVERKRVIVQYWRWLTTTDAGRERLVHVHELKGKILGCFCAPKLCHGDVLSALANHGYAYTAARMRATYDWLDAHDKKEK